MQMNRRRRLLSSLICLLLLLNASRGVVLCVGSAGHVALESALHNHHGNCPHDAQFPLDTPSSSPSTRPNDHPSAPYTCSHNTQIAPDPPADHHDSSREDLSSAANAHDTCNHDQPSFPNAAPAAHDSPNDDGRIAVHPDPYFQPTECTPCVDIPLWFALPDGHLGAAKAKLVSQTALSPAAPQASLSTALAPFTNSPADPLTTSFFQPLKTIILIA
ncbi:MAG: hypothetical protein JSU94_10035 [Phycisphaerales bacterium]|nr:MAG: hypothetical protein JSU94_10035 [Phycisphaerales bacterium]